MQKLYASVSQLFLTFLVVLRLVFYRMPVVAGGMFVHLFSLLASGCSLWGVLQLTGLALVLLLSVKIVVVSRRRNRLSCFALPPMRNWFLGHMGIVSHLYLNRLPMFSEDDRI